MDKWLNRLAHVAVLAIAVAALVAVFRPQSPAATQVRLPYQPGEKLGLGEVALSAPTLLIATRSTCGFCTDSMPFYRTLTQVPIIWVAVGEDTTTNLNYLASHGLKADNVFGAGQVGLSRVDGTPTIVLVDEEGVVIRVWLGLLAPEGQDDVRSTLAALATSE